MFRTNNPNLRSGSETAGRTPTGLIVLIAALFLLTAILLLLWYTTSRPVPVAAQPDATCKDSHHSVTQLSKPDGPFVYEFCSQGVRFTMVTHKQWVALERADR